MQRIKIPFGGDEPRADARAGGPGRGVFRRHLPHHHAAGHPAPLHPHRRHAGRSSAGWRPSASRRAKRAATPSATSPPARWPASATPRRSTSRPTPRPSRSTCSAIRDTQDFGRKFKIAFSGCEHEACALVSHARPRRHRRHADVDGKEVRGFELYVGGGLGAVPHQAKLLIEFVPEEELLPLARAIGRVFARLGEKKNRNKARLKFVVQKLGIDEFRELVVEERATMPDDPSLAEVLRRDPRATTRSPRAGRVVQLSVNGKKPRRLRRAGQRPTSTTSGRPATSP